MAKGNGRGWFRRKKGSLVYTWLNDIRKERTKVVGPDTISDAEGWVRVGELGLDKLASKPDPLNITFGALGAQYLDRCPFNKLSSKELHEQIIRRLLMLKWRDVVAIEIEPRELKAWFLQFDVSDSTRGKYKTMMSTVYTWGQCEGLIPRGEQHNPCNYVKGREFSQVSTYEALALEVEDTFKVLSELQQPEYELALLIATCGLRISEALGLRWRDILWERGLIAIRQTFVHLKMQDGAKTKLSRSRVETPTLLLAALAAWRKETVYAGDGDYVFASKKLGGAQPRSGSMLVEDYLRPAAIRAGVLKVVDGVTRGPDGDPVRRFGFHNLGRHSLATFLMGEGENPALVQAIMRHAKLDMTLYYSHSRRKQKLAAQEKVLQRLLPHREQERERQTIQ
jgi:integrase